MTTALRFRNIDASPDDPVETWPFEGILAAVERGTLPDWRRLATAIRTDPWGPVARQVLEAVQLRGENGNLAVSPADLHVWPGRALSNLDGTDAEGRAPRP